MSVVAVAASGKEPWLGTSTLTGLAFFLGLAALAWWSYLRAVAA